MASSPLPAPPYEGSTAYEAYRRYQFSTQLVAWEALHAEEQRRWMGVERAVRNSLPAPVIPRQAVLDLPRPLTIGQVIDKLGGMPSMICCRFELAGLAVTKDGLHGYDNRTVGIEPQREYLSVGHTCEALMSVLGKGLPGDRGDTAVITPDSPVRVSMRDRNSDTRIVDVRQINSYTVILVTAEIAD